jgi:hypothetical protein
MSLQVVDHGEDPWVEAAGEPGTAAEHHTIRRIEQAAIDRLPAGVDHQALSGPQAPQDLQPALADQEIAGVPLDAMKDQQHSRAYSRSDSSSTAPSTRSRRARLPITRSTSKGGIPVPGRLKPRSPAES